MPKSGDATVVHGDFRVGNVMYAPQAPARLVAIVDWEMSTIGDPLADLGYLTTFWFERDDPSWGLPAGEVTRAEGFFTRDEILARYEERSGRSMSDARWYQVLALWKIIVFMEGNYRRALAGSVDDPYLTSFGEAIAGLAERAEAITR
jgi:aminoglycoside phosphotransferase (APT) family kinase protein